MKSASCFFLLQLLVVVNAAPSHAADCDSVLVPTIEDDRSNHTLGLSYLRLIDEKQFTDRKRSMNGTASIPIVDDLIKVSANWEEFQRQRASYLSIEQFGYTESGSRSTLKTYLPESVLKAWSTCKTDEAGVAIYARNPTETSLTLLLEWNPPRGSATVKGRIEVSGGLINQQSFVDVNFEGRVSRSWLVTRTAGQDLHVLANVQSYSDDLLLPRLDPSMAFKRTCRIELGGRRIVADASWLEISDVCIDFNPGRQVSVSLDPSATIGLTVGNCGIGRCSWYGRLLVGIDFGTGNFIAENEVDTTTGVNFRALTTPANLGKQGLVGQTGTVRLRIRLVDFQLSERDPTLPVGNTVDLNNFIVTIRQW